MSDIDELLEAEGAAAERAESTPHGADLLAGSTVTRGHPRSKTLQVRLTEVELEVIENLAAMHELPASTYARQILLRAVHAEQVAAGGGDASLVDTMNRLERELGDLRRRLTSA